jgi:copper resistance protein B
VKRSVLPLLALPLLQVSGVALCQAAVAVEAGPHAGHVMPPPAAALPAAATPAAGPAADPPAGPAMPPQGATAPGVSGSPPAPPADHAADRFFPPAEMAAARAQLRQEHGGEPASMVLFNILELQPYSRGAFRWDGEAWYGGDINRAVVKTEGEGDFDEGIESFELQGLYSRAVDPYFDLQLGVRHDFKPGPSRTYAVLGLEGLAPSYYDVEAALFASHKGEFFARLAAWYDERITQRLILQPGVEMDFSAQRVRALGIGSGVTGVELGLRLRYEIQREFAPYIGLTYERKFAGTADFARLRGDSVSEGRVVAGARAWF